MEKKRLFLKRVKSQLLMNMNTDAAIIMKLATLKNLAAVVIIMARNIAAASMRITMKNTTAAALTIMKNSMKCAVMTTVRKAMTTAVNMVTLMKKDIIMTMIAAVAVMIMNMSKTAWTPIGMFPALILLNTVCSSLPSVRLQVLRTSV